MSLKVGDSLPEATFKTPTADGPKDITTAEIFAGKTVVLFAVPGAFTPACSLNHLPGYVHNAPAISDKGVDTIAVVSVNDVFVMDAWSKASDPDHKVLFLADGSAAFTKAVGLDLDATGFGMGVRSRRYSALVRDGVVEQINVEDVAGKVEKSGADAMLASL